MNSSAFMEHLKQLFAECDTDKNGSLGWDEFSELCSKIGLSERAADETFKRLDVDRNDRITFDEFAAGFNQYSKQISIQPEHHAQSSASCHQLTSSSGDTCAAQTSSPAASPKPEERIGSHCNQSGSKRASGRNGNWKQLAPPSPRGRKSASPIGVMSLGFGANGEENSMARCCSVGANVGTLSNYSDSDNQDYNRAPFDGKSEPMVVYSSDAIDSYDQQAGGSGQFNSLLSSNSSFNQMRSMQDLLDCVQKLQSENQILSQIFFKDKREREEYISQLGEEFDQQVREVEERANRRAKEELESEKRRLREMMQAERETLQHHYQTIERMSKIIKAPNGKFEDSESIDKVRSKLEDTYLENRQLKQSLMATKTDVAMIWKEMEKLKRQYEDKLSSAYERNNETRSECDHIKQQLNLMKDSNRKLQDASDVITNYITDKVEPVIKSAEEDSNYLNLSGCQSLTGSQRLGIGSQSNSRRGSILSEYLNGGDLTNSTDGFDPSMNSGDLESLGSSSQGRPTKLAEEADERISITSSSTGIQHAPKPPPRACKLESSKYLKKNAQAKLMEHEVDSTKQQVGDHDRRLQRNINDDHLNGKLSSKTRSIGKLDEAPTNRSNIRNIGRHFFLGRRSQVDEKLLSKCHSEGAVDSSTLVTAADGSNPPMVEPSDGPSKDTFNIILVGDSFVGKSSFATRFIEGNFVQGLISNCSIDFKTKSYKVDGINYTVNLWDTA